MDTVEQLRDWANSIRRKPAPLSDAIPMVCNAADEIESIRKQLAAALAAIEAKDAALMGLMDFDDPGNHQSQCECDPDVGYRCKACGWAASEPVVSAWKALSIKPDASALNAHDAASSS